MSAFSLPTQRCFFAFTVLWEGSLLFSAYAEVFPKSTVSSAVLFSFSLPTQRCFQPSRLRPERRRLFSAYAEVFPSRRHGASSFRAFLCLRRGVSYSMQSCSLSLAFSLPTQRCFKVFGERPVADEPFLCLRRGVSIGSS